jgi:hypothetical protein
MILNCLPVLIILRSERKISAKGKSRNRVWLDNVEDIISLFDLKRKSCFISYSQSANVCVSYHTHVKIKIVTVLHLSTSQIVPIVEMETESILVVFILSGGFTR